MSQRTLTFIPSGGLANRMRAIASAVNLYEHTHRTIKVIWFCDWGLEARFCDIFEPIKLQDITLKDATLFDKIVSNRPRMKNLWIPRLFQDIIFSKRIDEQFVTPLKETDFNFDKWAASEDKRLYMSCYQVFGTFDDYNALIRKLFVPIPSIQAKINSYTQQFSQHTVGLHIRRTDNAESIQCSPTERFLEIADSEIAADNSTKIYLATDDEPTKDVFRKKYGDRVITPSAPASRESLEGIRDGIVDMWTLAATDTIYGSKGSSFSPMAASIGGNKIVIVE